MSNTYFKFKQFVVHQDACAMKVGTDGVLLGAWANLPFDGKVIDVGCGTGVISLMCAQRNDNINIIAVDVDENACLQADSNFKESKWNSRLSVVNESIIDYSELYSNEFDALISNPPFFNENVLSEDQKRNTARHSQSLPFDKLVLSINRLLKNNGIASIIIPYVRFEEFILLIEQNCLFITRFCIVKPTPNKKPHRVLLEISKQKQPLVSTELIIEKHGRHNYSDEFINLLSEFYLKF